MPEYAALKHAPAPMQDTSLAVTKTGPSDAQLSAMGAQLNAHKRALPLKRPRSSTGVDEETTAAQPAEKSKPDFGGFLPSEVSDTEIPSADAVYHLKRSGSLDFSDQFQSKFGLPTDDARKSTIKMSTAANNSYTTRGTGRFMSVANSQLGKTAYRDFLPKLPEKIGQSEPETAQLLLDSLTDRTAYTLKASLLSSTSQLALEQASMLFHNEIIHRSSSNLPAITGILHNVASGKTPSLIGGFNETALFLPTAKDSSSNTGGQQLSRLHQENSIARPKLDADKIEPELVTLLDANRKAWGGLAKQKGKTIPDLASDVSALNKLYLDSLASHVTIGKK